MKKYLIVFVVILLCVFLTGCKKENKKEKVGGWEIDTSSEKVAVTNDALDVFNKTKKKNYKLVALLGTQVVSGTNYMYLVHDDSKYYVMIIYNDLKGNSKVSSISYFDILKYAYTDIESIDENLVGSWNVSVLKYNTKLDEDIQKALDKALKNVKGITYSPIALLASQVVSGTNYAIICYGTPDGEKPGIYVITLYKDLNGNSEIITSSYVDLKEFNK